MSFEAIEATLGAPLNCGATVASSIDIKPLGMSLSRDLSRRVYGILGIPVDVIDENGIFEAIEAAVDERTPFLLSTPNLNYLVNGRSNSEFRESLLSSDLCPADGFPIVWLARMLGAPVDGRHSGADIFEKLKDRKGKASQTKVYLFGGAEGVATKVSSLINSTAQHMTCVGFSVPGFGSVEEMSTQEIVDQINSSGADILTVFLSAAKGQSWLLQNHDRVSIPVRAHLGATINFQAGIVRRAPPIMMKYGLEWLWRIKEEPYLWRRYWNDGLILVSLFVTSALPLALTILSDRLLNRTPLQVESRETGDLTTLKLAGGATEREIEKLTASCQEAVSSKKDIELDLAGVQTVDARFVGLVLMLRKSLKTAGKRLLISGANSKVRRIFRLSGFEFLMQANAARV